MEKNKNKKDGYERPLQEVMSSKAKPDRGPKETSGPREGQIWSWRRSLAGITMDILGSSSRDFTQVS